MYLLIEKWESLTHGTVGIIGIPAPPAIGRIDFDGRRVAVLPGAVLPGRWGLWIMHRIVRSLLGRTFMAIRNGDDLAEALGINLMRNKLLAFMLSVFYAGLAGGLYAGLRALPRARAWPASSTPST
jgi:branched-chain amino acid transport system permease protein